ncbi:HAD-IIA family hydrolase [Oceanobacillus senegalensis]|uniref:HAD-IIA family hydrolase n=1 Tax=Oceanobacillus senegalensis TaxID=1936063 RepID=UPI000A30B39C|nr:HAD-IIA family hydrolase [Oceanobacillus senegalensis]
MITIQDYDVYAFDLDGTIYVENMLLPGVADTLEYIRSRGKKIRFITNASTTSRERCKERLERLGLTVQLEEVITALYLTVQYFKQHPLARVYVVGDERVKDELHQQGIAITDEPRKATHVLVGHDRAFSYKKIQHAMDAIHHGARLTVINPDPTCPVADGYIPDTMSFAKAIEVASGRAIDQIIGKPSDYYGNRLLDISEADPGRILIVGDRLETDIMLGKSNGFSTCLVLTGVASKQDIRDSIVKPDYVIESIGELFALELLLK